VEIDPETGQVSLRRYSGIDDVGHIVNPMIVDGQLQAGVTEPNLASATNGPESRPPARKIGVP
jgi:hypothetical protein